MFGTYLFSNFIAKNIALIPRCLPKCPTKDQNMFEDKKMVNGLYKLCDSWENTNIQNIRSMIFTSQEKITLMIIRNPTQQMQTKGCW